jgi:PAS domain S-box-containing protein
MHIFRIKLLKNVMAVSMAIIIGLPIIYIAIIYPAFSRLLTQNIKSEVTRTAQHIRNLAVSNHAYQKALTVPDDLNKEIIIIKRDFELEKIRILSPSGEIIYSTNPEDVGLKNNKSYYYNIVAKGQSHTREEVKQLPSPENQVIAGYILEAYVPLMGGDQFLGAFEIQYDISDHRERLNELFWQSFLYVFAFVCGLFILNILLVVNASKTIVAQKRTEAALEDSELKNRLIVENATEGIVVAQDGRIKFVNRKAQEIAGYSGEELVSRPFVDFIHQDDREPILEGHHNTMKGEEVSNNHQMRLVDKHNHEKWAEINTIRIDWEGKPATLSFINDVTARKQAEDSLIENEEYLRTIMRTIQTGVVIIDPNTRKIVDANPYASTMFGCEIYELLGRDYQKHLSHRPNSCEKVEAEDCVLQTANKGSIQIRQSEAMTRIKGRDYVVQSMQDITDIKELLIKQEINIDLAKNILGVINTTPPRYTNLNNDHSLFFDAIFLPCHAAGGDHFFVRSLASDTPNGHGKTVVSLKDQSGHEVGCVLRNILTDLIHNTVLNNKDEGGLEEATSRLNDEICHSQLFQEEDFFTSINAEIDHGTLDLRYISCGHPPFFLIRGEEIIELPEPQGLGTNMPMAVVTGMVYSAGEYQLQPGDKLIFYTDGLSEMPVRNRKKIITSLELKKTIGDTIKGDPQLPVSEIIHAMVAEIANQSGEEVVPQDIVNGPKNSSGDDITVLGLEVEDRRHYQQQVLMPRDFDDVSRSIVDLYTTLKSEWQQRGYGSAELFLRTVCEETILNAWKHGNRQDLYKSITVRWRFGNDFHLEVLDEGLGFDYENIPDPTAAKNITRDSGRGIFLVRRFADSVKWKKGGKHIVMTFKKHAKPAGIQPLKQAA